MSRFSAHATAIVDERAKIGDGAEIGPYCTIGPNVALGRGVILVSHVVVTGRTTIGEETRVFPFASLGSEPQDLKFKGEEDHPADRSALYDPRRRHHEPRHGRRR